MDTELPIMSFKNRKVLREWLIENHANSKGIYLRIYKRHSNADSVTFEDVLGTESERNKRHAKRLIGDGLMTDAGLAALGEDIVHSLV